MIVHSYENQLPFLEPAASQQKVLDPAKRALKPVSLSYKWSAHFGNVQVKAPLNALKRVGLGIKWLELPKKVKGFFEVKGDVLEKSVKITKLSTSLFAVIGGTLKLLNEENLIHLSSHHLSVINGVGVVGCVSLIFKSLYDIRDVLAKPLDGIVALSLCVKICKLAAGVLGTYFFVFGGSVKFLLLSLSTVSFVCSNYKFFYNESLLVN